MRYEGDIYSPHTAGDDYILQCTIGCSHNQCTFCSMCKEKSYRIRDLDEIFEDIELAKKHYGDIKKVFLADGDALTMLMSSLITVLDRLYATFPNLFYVGTYASPKSILNKTPLELRQLKAHGLVEAHLGVESGDEKVLCDIHKGVSYNQMVTAAKKVRESGISLFITIILGIAGRTPHALVHAKNTARICNDIQPDYIGALTVMVFPGTDLYKQVENGAFEVPTDMEILDEMRIVIEGLELEHCGFTSIHPSNCLHLEGMLPKNKSALLQAIARAIDGTDPILPRRHDRAQKI